VNLPMNAEVRAGRAWYRLTEVLGAITNSTRVLIYKTLEMIKTEGLQA
jgi:hypothetical protein